MLPLKEISKIVVSLMPKRKNYVVCEIQSIRQCEIQFHNFKPNLTQAEKTALKYMKSNENIIITKAEKGKQIVILDKNDYIEDVNKLLNNSLHIICHTIFSHKK